MSYVGYADAGWEAVIRLAFISFTHAVYDVKYEVYFYMYILNVII